MTIEQDIDELKAAATEAERLEKLKQAYPNVKTYVGRWDKKVYCTADVNFLVDQHEKRFNCGCCGDSPLELWTYLETENGRVYSDPPKFVIGEKDYVLDFRLDEGWEDDLLQSGLNPSFVSRTKIDLQGLNGRVFEKCTEMAKSVYGENAYVEVHNFSHHDWWATVSVEREVACDCGAGKKDYSSQKISIQGMKSGDAALRVLLGALDAAEYQV